MSDKGGEGGDGTDPENEEEFSGDEGDKEDQDLGKLSRPELLKKITDIWLKKKENNRTLVKLSEEIEIKKEEIHEIKTKMAIESNDLNVIGNEILKIENKIKELTQAGKN